MKIYSMTATFGKLENQTLILQPGLNVIHAPNEWGKSTWCSFLAIMLYGLETRVKTTKTALAEISDLYGFKTAAIVTMPEVVEILKEKNALDEELLARIDAYYAEYGAAE